MSSNVRVSIWAVQPRLYWQSVDSQQRRMHIFKLQYSVSGFEIWCNQVILTSSWTKGNPLGLITGHGRSENVKPYNENLLAFSSTIAPADKIFSVKNYILTKAEKALLNCSTKSLINLTSHPINVKKCLYKLNLKKEMCSILDTTQTIVISIQEDVATYTIMNKTL